MEKYFHQPEGTFTSPIDKGALQEAGDGLKGQTIPDQEAFKQSGQGHLKSMSGTIENKAGFTMAGQKEGIQSKQQTLESGSSDLKEKASDLSSMDVASKRSDMKASYKNSNTADINKAREGVTTHVGSAIKDIDKALGSRADDSSLTMQPKFGKMGTKAHNKKEHD